MPDQTIMLGRAFYINMKTFVTFFAAMTVALGSQASRNIDISTVASHLSGQHDYAATATFELLLPTSDNPVVYIIKLAATANDGDSLAPADYLIDWEIADSEKAAKGFTSYFSGNHYRYRDQRLQEYHINNADDAPGFAPGGDISKGVQNLAQFCDLLPQYIGSTFAAMQNDSTYKYKVHADTVISQQKVIAIDGVRSFGGVDALEYIYLFDRDFQPLKSELISNPGQIGEQSITVTYDYGDDEPLTVALSEQQLSDSYPEIFRLYRESTFSLDNLPGRRLPSFSAPTLNGDRYNHTKNTKFTVPTIIAVLDADAESTAATISELRKAISTLPSRVDLIMAFVTNNADKIESLAGQLLPGEQLLMSARGLARDCKISETPVIIICDRDAVVKDLQVGFNNEIGDFVIKKMELINE